MRSTRRLLVALVARVIAAGLFIVLLTQAYNSKNSPSAGGGTNAEPQVSVVVAVPPPGLTSLPAGTKLTATNVKLAPIPQSQFSQNPTAYLSATTTAIGQYISVSLPAGAPVLGSFLIAEAPSQNNTLSRAPLPIDQGFEAVAIPYDPTKDLGGYIQPGDHLDLLISEAADQSLHYAFQNVLVLRVVPGTGTGATGGGQLVVELTPQKVATISLLLAESPSAIVRIAERPASATGTLPAKPVNPGNVVQPGFTDG